MLQLKNAPLFSYTLIFLIGCILGTYDLYWFPIFLLCIVIISSVLLLVRIGSYRFHLFFLSLFLFLGCIHMQSVFPKGNDIDRLGQDQYVIVEIEQQLRKGDKWETDIGMIKSVYKDGKWERINERTVFIAEKSTQLMRVGDKVLVKTKIESIKNLGNPGEFDAPFYWLSKGVRYQCFGFSTQLKIIESNGVSAFESFKDNVRNYISALFDKYIGVEQSDVVKAIFLGDKSDLDMETKNAFANAGAMHVLAVSGLHVGIITLIILWIFQHIFVGLKRNTAYVILILLLWTYALITGFSASVTRAVLMFSMIGIAQISGRINNPINALAFSALVLMVWNPVCIFDIGFQLSYLAVLGIFLTYSSIEKLIYVKNKVLLKVWQVTAVSLSAQVLTVPVSLYYFHQFPNYFMLSNISVMIFSGTILGVAIALVFLGKIPFLNVLLGWVLCITTFFLSKSIEWVEQLPGAVALGFDIPVWLMLLSYLVILLILFDVSQKRKFLWLTMLFPLFILVQFPRVKNSNLNELCIFNSKATIMLAKLGDSQICIYSGDERAKKEAEFKVRDYQRIHPGKIEFKCLIDQHLILKSSDKTIELIDDKDVIYVKINDTTHIQVMTSNRSIPDVKNKGIKILKSKIENYSDGISLSNGAFRISI